MKLKALTAALMLGAAPAAASPLQMFGFGARSPALAATGVAAADDFECLYLNPSGLAEITGRRVSAGTVFGSFDLDGAGRPLDTTAGVEVGSAFPLPLGGVLRGRVGLGFGIYVPTTVLNRARAPAPGVPFFTLLESRTQVVGVQIGGGVKISRQWSAGIGMLVLGGLAGGIDVKPDASGRFATTSEQQLIASYSPIAGVRFHPTDKLSFGTTFRLRSKSTYNIKITADLGDALPVTIPAIRIQGVAQYDPTTVAAEVGWRPVRRLLLNGQLAWEHWSAYPLPTVNPVSGTPAQEPADFHDTLVPRLGAEWIAGRLRLRAGYSFVLSPAPEMTGQQALLDNHRNVIAAGAGFLLGPLHLDAWAQAHLLVARHHDRPEGTPDLDTGGHILVGGFMLGVDL